jgi:hypothetical protein
MMKKKIEHITADTAVETFQREGQDREEFRDRILRK